jgi:WD40 repeat protein
VRRLLERLRDPKPDTRRWAALALGYCEDPSTRPALRRSAARDPRAEVRAAAKLALASLQKEWTRRRATAPDQAGHRAVILSLALSSDGRTLVTAGRDGTVRVWDVQERKATWIFSREDRSTEKCLLDGMALSADGKVLAIGTAFEGVLLFSMTTGRVLAHVDVGDDRVIFGGQALTTAHRSSRRWIRFIDSRGRTRRRVRAPSDLSHIACGPEGQPLAIRTDGWSLMAVPGGQVVHTFDGDSEQATFSPDGGALAFASYGEGALWDLRTLSLLGTFRVPPEARRHRIDVAPPAFSRRGDRLALGQSVWDAATGALLWMEPDPAWTRASVFSPDGRQVAFAGDRHQVLLRNAESGEVEGTLGQERNEVRGIAVSPDGRSVAAVHEDGTVRVWDLERHTPVAELGAEGLAATCVTFTPDGHLVIGGKGGVVRATGGAATLAAPMRPWDGPVSSVAALPGGKLAIGGQLGSPPRTTSAAVVWDPSTGALDQISAPNGGRVLGSPDGSLVATWWWGKLALHHTADPRTPIRVLSLPGEGSFGDEISEAAFSPGGETLATGTGGFHLALWDTASWEIRRFIDISAGDCVHDLAFSPDGRLLAVVTSYAYEVEVRDVETGALLGLLGGHTDNARAVAFTPDGATIVTGAADGTLRLWESATSRLRATLAPA